MIDPRSLHDNIHKQNAASYPQGIEVRPRAAGDYIGELSTRLLIRERAYHTGRDGCDRGTRRQFEAASKMMDRIRELIKCAENRADITGESPERVLVLFLEEANHYAEITKEDDGRGGLRSIAASSALGLVIDEAKSVNKVLAGKKTATKGILAAETLILPGHPEAERQDNDPQTAAEPVARRETQADDKFAVLEARIAELEAETGLEKPDLSQVGFAAGGGKQPGWQQTFEETFREPAIRKIVELNYRLARVRGKSEQDAKDFAVAKLFSSKIIEGGYESDPLKDLETALLPD